AVGAAGQDADSIGFPALAHEGALAGAAPVEIGLDVDLGEGETRRTAVHHGADGGSVGLAPGGHAEELAEAVAHADSEDSRRSRRQPTCPGSPSSSFSSGGLSSHP